MDTEEFLAIGGFIVLVAIPALALTARFAMKPIVESILQLRKAFADERPAHGIDAATVQMLEREVADLRREVEALKNLREFDLALRPGGAPQIEEHR